MMILLDTSAYSAIGRGKRGVIELLASASRTFVPAVVIGELSHGFLKGNHTTKNSSQLASFLREKEVSICDIDQEIALIYGMMKHQQQSSGKIVATNDLWIAASAVYLGAKLVTYDTDFLKIEHKDFQVIHLS